MNISELKNPIIDRVCPICRVFGKNVKFMDLRDDKIGVSLTIVTCMTCKAVYSMDCEIVEPKDSGPKDGKPIP